MILSFKRLNFWCVPDPSRGRRGVDFVLKGRAVAATILGRRFCVFLVG